MATVRRKWTARERKLVEELAREQLSAYRATYALQELYGVITTPKALSAFASRNKIRFHGEAGAPVGNVNRTGKLGRSDDEKRLANRSRMRRRRAVKRLNVT